MSVTLIMVIKFFYKEKIAMKLLRILTAGIMILALLGTAVCATEFVPSISEKDSVEPEENEDIVVITPGHYDDKDNTVKNLYPEVEDILDDVEDELRENDVEDMIDQFKDAWNKITGGAPLDNALIHDIFYVRYVDPQKTGENVAFQVTVDGITADDLFLIVYKPNGSDEWHLAEYSIDENNVITIVGDIPATYVIIVDNGAAPAVEVYSPQTGINTFAAAAAVLGMAALAVGGVVIGKKIRKTNAQ